MSLNQIYNKVLYCLRVNGWWYTIRKILQTLLGTADPQNNPKWPEIQKRHFERYPQYDPTRNIVSKVPTTSVEDYLRNQDAGCSPIDSVITAPMKCMRLNVVTDSLEKDSLFGGVATAIVIATKFAQENDIPLRIITRAAPTNPRAYYNIVKMNQLEAPKKVTFFSDCNRDAKGKSKYKLELTEQDVFLATSWWSAEAIRRTSLRKRFFYVIQEVETFFYNYGDMHYRCSQIMNNPNIDFIVNSHYLWDYFAEWNKNIVDHGVCFEPAFSNKMFCPGKFEKDKKKYKLFFYSRPNNSRNLFGYGIYILNEAVRKGILDTEEWEICFAGQDVPALSFCNGYSPKRMGRLDWNEYAAFLKTVDLTLSLMYTPHPSYPPYDAACSGNVVLTNTFLNKKSFDQCANVLMSSLDEEDFLKALEDAIDRAKDMDTREKNCLNSTILHDWNQSLQDTMRFMRGCV